MKGVTILGATGTIGTNTLDVIARQRDKFFVVALTAHSQVERLAEQCEQHHPRFAVLHDPRAAEQLQRRLHTTCPDTRVLSGEAGLCQVAADPACDYVMAAIVGAVGLKPTLAAVRAGKRILLANKEALVMSGEVFMRELREHGAQLLPIDSEHNAIFQCMPADYSGADAAGIRRILLTASGGPFRALPLEHLMLVTPEQAIAHPNWTMGKKISVDSATMMNKGLEVIEACWLFDLKPNQIEVVVHPQSIIHSMVEYLDGSIIAQLGQPDMRTPIAHALAWPARMASGVKPLNLFDITKLEFLRPDLQRYPCLQLAHEAIERGGTATAVLNAANEIAVQAFLDRKIAFTSIAVTVEHVLAKMPIAAATTLEVIGNADQHARCCAQEFIQSQARRAGVL
ncbi:MAG: 1-deoxy-D-xylulose-5-phosphate reductoisomerase [Gammaproteobacteria bacterium]|nr:1-deoxy-D-xylulose-5-phosphate reductoisomerase [Gammaproteobacteria bacterium]